MNYLSIANLYKKIIRRIQTPFWKFSLLTWLMVNLLLSGLGAIVWGLHNPIRPNMPSYLWNTTPIEEGWKGAVEGVWLRWDAIHYLRITNAGYASEELTAFFPLYPLLSRVAGQLLGIDGLAGLLLVSRLSFLLTLVLLYKITEEWFDDKIAKNTILTAAFSPMAVFWLAPYPHSLALFLTLLSIWNAKKSHWFAAALAGLLAGLTHGTTIPLSFSLLIILVQKNSTKIEKKTWLIIPATVTPVLGTVLFLSWRIFKGYPDFNALQFQYWGRVMQMPWQIVGDFQHFLNTSTIRIDGWINLSIFVYAIGVFITAFRKLPLVCNAYLITLFILICSTTTSVNPFGSVGRFLLTAFPIFLATVLDFQRKWGRVLILGIFLVTMILITICFFEWYWVA